MWKNINVKYRNHPSACWEGFLYSYHYWEYKHVRHVCTTNSDDYCGRQKQGDELLCLSLTEQNEKVENGLNKCNKPSIVGHLNVLSLCGPNAWGLERWWNLFPGKWIQTLTSSQTMNTVPLRLKKIENNVDSVNFTDILLKVKESLIWLWRMEAQTEEISGWMLIEIRWAGGKWGGGGEGEWRHLQAQNERKEEKATRLLTAGFFLCCLRGGGELCRKMCQRRGRRGGGGGHCREL